MFLAVLSTNYFSFFFFSISLDWSIWLDKLLQLYNSNESAFVGAYIKNLNRYYIPGYNEVVHIHNLSPCLEYKPVQLNDLAGPSIRKTLKHTTTGVVAWSLILFPIAFDQRIIWSLLKLKKKSMWKCLAHCFSCWI